MNIVFSFITNIINNINDRKIVIYGTLNKCTSIYNYFCVMNLESYVIGFISEDIVNDSDTPDVKAISKYDLLYKKDEVCVIIAGLENRKEDILNICKDIQLYYWGFDSACRADIIDPLLGYSRSDKLEGYTVHEYDASPGKPLKIMITGGSTTDGAFSNMKSWPEFLSEILRNRNISHIIYNGGMVGYNSSQELMKIIRDISILSPHIVISYSGVNDFYKGTNNFKHPYTPLHICNNVFKVINEYIHTINEKCTNSDICTPLKISYGLEYNYHGGLIWYKNITRMRAITHSENASFYGILQPTAFSEGYSLEDQLNQYIHLQHSERAIHEIIDNNKYAESMICKVKDIFSFSHIFNDEKEIFYDHAHCSEYGNFKIATEIIKIIEKNEYFRYFSIIS